MYTQGLVWGADVMLTPTRALWPRWAAVLKQDMFDRLATLSSIGNEYIQEVYTQYDHRERVRERAQVVLVVTSILFFPRV